MSDARAVGRPRGLGGAELLAVARGLFLEQGFARTSMDDIARAARISKASLYRAHATKAELFAAVVADWAAAGRDAMRPALDDLAAAGDVRRGLVAFAEVLRTALVGETVTRMRRLVIAEAETQPEVAARYAADSWDRNVAALAETLRGLDEAGRLAVGDPAAAAEQLTWLVAGAAVNAALLGGSAPPAASVEDAVEVFLARHAVSA